MTTQTLYYQAIDRSDWVLQPQLTIWRHRYRGQHESLKVDTEINQVAYDIYRLYARTNNFQVNLSTDLQNIETGPVLTNQYHWAKTNTTINASPPGELSIVQRLQSLLMRVTYLENGGWPSA